MNENKYHYMALEDLRKEFTTLRQKLGYNSNLQSRKDFPSFEAISLNAELIAELKALETELKQRRDFKFLREQDRPINNSKMIAFLLIGLFLIASSGFFLAWVFDSKSPAESESTHPISVIPSLETPSLELKQEALGTESLLPIGDGTVLMERYEVSAYRYSLCVQASKCDAIPGNSVVQVWDRFPAVNVDALNAQKFCLWLDRRLPTLQEWERATGKIHQDQLTNQDANLFHENRRDDARLEPIGAISSRASKDGIYDLIGNVYEWTTTVWGMELQPWRGEDVPLYVVGGSYKVSPGALVNVQAGIRTRADDIGFRCVDDTTP